MFCDVFVGFQNYPLSRFALFVLPTCCRTALYYDIRIGTYKSLSQISTLLEITTGNCRNRFQTKNKRIDECSSLCCFNRGVSRRTFVCSSVVFARGEAALRDWRLVCYEFLRFFASEDIPRNVVLCCLRLPIHPPVVKQDTNSYTTSTPFRNDRT